MPILFDRYITFPTLKEAAGPYDLERVEAAFAEDRHFLLKFQLGWGYDFYLLVFHAIDPPICKLWHIDSAVYTVDEPDCLADDPVFDCPEFRIPCEIPFLFTTDRFEIPMVSDNIVISGESKTGKYQIKIEFAQGIKHILFTKDGWISPSSFFDDIQTNYQPKDPVNWLDGLTSHFRDLFNSGYVRLSPKAVEIVSHLKILL